MDLADLVSYVRQQRDGVVATLGPGGAPQAAYLELTATDAGEVVFDARPTSRKVANVARDGRVAVVVGGADGTTLQAEGEADLPTGPDGDRCRAAYVAAFPQYAASLADGLAVLVRVRLVWARHGDFRVTPPVLRTITFDQPVETGS